MAFKVDENNVRILGRTVSHSGVRYLNYSCCGIEFEFTGTKVSAVLWTDGARGLDEFKAWVAVFINGEEVPSKRFALDETECTYTLYESEVPHTATIRLIKLSEAAFAKVGVKSIEVEGGQKTIPTQPKQRKIEFIGDSITCGYGIEGIWNKDTFNTKQENPWEAYAAQTARYFNADFHCISWSGIGLISSWTEKDIPNDEWLMPMLYAYTDIGIEKTLGLATYEKWHNDRFKPDLIVINLGTNDASYTKKIKERMIQFGSAYYAFLQQIRSANPQAEIICTLGVMGDDLYTEIERQVTCYRKNEQDIKVHAMPFDLQVESDGIGADWHPSLRTQKHMALKLIHEVKDKLSW